MWSKMFIMLGVFIVVVGSLAAVKTVEIQQAIANGAKMAPPPPAITTAVVLEEEWPDTLLAIGTVQAVQGVQVSSEVDGRVTAIFFDSGEKVQAGQVLVQLDTSIEEAELASAQAQADLAKIDGQRSRELRATDAVPQSHLDAALAEERRSQAVVEQIKAIIAKKQVKAPFAGRLGLRQVNLGQNLRAGDPVAALETFDQVYINFALPQQHLSRLSLGQKVRVTVDAFLQQEFPGMITAINPRVDDATRNIMIQATLPNPEDLLLPGMYARVEVKTGESPVLVTIPASAISYNPYGDAVYVLDDVELPDGSKARGVRQVFVKLGPSRGDQVAVLSGLSAGQEIATSGIMKLRNNTPVQVNNEIQPSASAAPQPVES